MSTPDVAIIHDAARNFFRNHPGHTFRVEIFRFLKLLIINPELRPPPAIINLIDSTFKGLKSGSRPVRSLEGSGGVYLMRNARDNKYVSVFKPIDEEPKGLKKGTELGGGAVREVAAYILDRGFSGIPPTVMVELNKKVGSLQKYVDNDGSCENFGPAGFPVSAVHRLAVLDIRLANVDRHAGNILVRKDGDKIVDLVPIDHGYCFPDTFEDCTFEWLYWPQAREAFSNDVAEYVNKLDVEKDIEQLRRNGWNIPPACARVLRVATMLLKKGVKRGMTAYGIGKAMCRQTAERLSVVENIVLEVDCSDEADFVDSVSKVMDRYLETISP